MIASDDEWVDETEWDNMFMKMKKEREKDSEYSIMENGYFLLYS